MDIIELESKYRNFYSPTATIKVDDKDLLTEGVEVLSTTVDNSLEGADQFSFVVNNAFDIDKRQMNWIDNLFAIGKRVEIKMGYLDKLELMLLGLITDVKTDYPASGLPQITVSGYDYSYRMMKCRKSEALDKKKDSQVVPAIAKEYGLKVGGLDDSKLELPRVEKSQESDFQFLTRLARYNGYEFYVFKNTLYFKKPENEASPTVTLEWGKGLVSFSPEVNLSNQYKKVEVLGWDNKAKKPIVGTATIKDLPVRDKKRKSGGELLKPVMDKRDAVYRERRPVFSKQEAKIKAIGIFKKLAEGLVKGRGEAVGIPELFIDQNIELKGLGDRFNRIYYIESTQHSFTTSGYQTTFNVKETTY
jgi:phage protein D